MTTRISLFPRSLGIVCGLALWLAAPFAHAEIRGIPEVIDGHTLMIGDTRVRLHGIYAPPRDQICMAEGAEYSCGERAAEALAERVADTPVSCQEEGVTEDGTVLANCFIDGTDLASWMARSGWALAYLDHSVNYLVDEAEAKAARAGLWQGEFEKPWEWEARHR